MKTERLLLFVNINLFLIFTHIYYVLYKYDNNSFNKTNLRYIDFFSISAQTHVGGPTNMRSSLSIVAGVFHMFCALFINIIELSSANSSTIGKIFTS